MPREVGECKRPLEVCGSKLHHIFSCLFVQLGFPYRPHEAREFYFVHSYAPHLELWGASSRFLSLFYMILGDILRMLEQISLFSFTNACPLTYSHLHSTRTVQLL